MGAKRIPLSYVGKNSLFSDSGLYIDDFLEKLNSMYPVKSNLGKDLFNQIKNNEEKNNPLGVFTSIISDYNARFVLCAILYNSVNTGNRGTWVPVIIPIDEIAKKDKLKKNIQEKIMLRSSEIKKIFQVEKPYIMAENFANLCFYGYSTLKKTEPYKYVLSTLCNNDKYLAIIPSQDFAKHCKKMSMIYTQVSRI